MSRWRGQSVGVQPIAGYTINRNGGLTPVIDVDAKVEIDLTGIDDNDDDEEIVFTGMRWDATGSKQQNVLEGGKKRDREQERQMRIQGNARRSISTSNGRTPAESGLRGGTVSSSRNTTRRPSAGPSHTFDTGPSPTIRPEINDLGARTQPRSNLEPPKKRLRRVDEQPAHQYYSTGPDEGPFDAPSYTPQPEQIYGYTYGDTMDIDMGPPAYEHISEPTKLSPSNYRLPPPTTRELPRNSPIPKIEPKIEPTFELKIEPEYDPRPIIEDTFKPLIEPEVGTDEEYECIHSGYDIKDESLWKAPKENTARLESDVIEAIQGWTLSNLSGNKKEQECKLRTSRTDKAVRPPKSTEFIWDLLEQVKKPTSANRSSQKPSRMKRDSTYGRDHSEKAMHVQASFKVAPGAINRIEQHCGWLAIASSCTGGQADEPDEQINPYNRSGSLLTWNGQHHILSGHFDQKAHGEKYYTINDVKFNNSGDYFLSAGMDKRVRVWKRPEGASMYSGGYELDVYNTGIPYEVAFQPGNANSNVVAVGVKDVHIYSSLEPTARRTGITLTLSSNPHHNTGSIRWDTNRPHILYASSEPQNDEVDGIHKAFDVNNGRTRLAFNVTTAGDAMAVDRVLALATRGAENNYLHLFDITGFSKNCVQKVRLEPFPKEASVREVYSMAFSPDGIYLSLARTDNSVHVYDTRMLNKGVLQKYRHKDPHFVSPESSLFGVTYAQWVSTRSGQYALLSGGEDGCVRLWNPMWSNEEPSNGRKVVEVNSDIGFFSVGDLSKKEHDLVVGDSSGEVTIFTGLLNHL